MFWRKFHDLQGAWDFKVSKKEIIILKKIQRQNRKILIQIHDFCSNFTQSKNFKFFFSARNSKNFVLGQAFARRYQIALVFGFVEKSGKDYYDSVIAIEGGSGDVEEIPTPQMSKSTYENRKNKKSKPQTVKFATKSILN